MPSPLTLNFYAYHLQHFVDGWLERAQSGRITPGDLHCAYDVWCRKHNVVHRKILTFDLARELAEIGVQTGDVRVRHDSEKTPGYVYHTTEVEFVGWRLSRNARYAIRGERRTVSRYDYRPVRYDTDDDDDGDARNAATRSAISQRG